MGSAWGCRGSRAGYGGWGGVSYRGTGCGMGESEVRSGGMGGAVGWGQHWDRGGGSGAALELRSEPPTPFINELYPPTPPSPPRQCAMAALTPRTNAAVTAPTWTPSTSEKWGGRGGTRRWGGGAGGRWAPRGGSPRPPPHNCARLAGACWILTSRSCAPSHCPTSTSTPAWCVGNTSRVSSVRWDGQRSPPTLCFVFWGGGLGPDAPSLPQAGA